MSDLQCGQKVVYRSFDLASNALESREGTIVKCMGNCVIMDDGWVIETDSITALATK